MNKEKIESILAQIEEASVQVGDSPIMENVSYYGLSGEPENEVLGIAWEDYKGYTYEAKFTEEGISNAEIDPSGCLILKDNEGEKTTITLFQMKKDVFAKTW